MWSRRLRVNGAEEATQINALVKQKKNTSFQSHRLSHALGFYTTDIIHNNS